MIPSHIIIAENKKIGNPYYKSTTDQFYGSVDEFNFKTQTLHYTNLTQKFKEFGIVFDEVYSSTIIRHTTYNTINYGLTFIVTTNNKKIFWYKYEGNKSGSGQNHILIDGNKIYVTKFLTLSYESIMELLGDN
jgi:hypothetical protein